MTVVSVRRAGGRSVHAPTTTWCSPAGDTLVLSGLPEALALAEEKLLRG